MPTYYKHGGLSGKDRGSDKKPYPMVAKKDFAGGNRSYPIPTKADATDALRLAGLHHRPDVKAKVYRKYPELKKKKYFAGGNELTTGLGAAAGVASMIPGGQIIGAGLGLASMVSNMINTGDKEREAVDKQNKLTAENEAIQMQQRTDVEDINQRNYGSNQSMNSFYKQGGNNPNKEYNDLKAFLQTARQAIGTNDTKTLSTLRLDKPYDTNNLAEDYNRLRELAKSSGNTSLIEEASTLFPQVGQQIRGSVNKILGTHFAKGGNALKPKYISGGQQLQSVAEDGVIVNGQSHEQGGVDYGDIEVEKGETIKKEADGDFVFSTEFKPDGKIDAGTISKQLFLRKQSLQQQSGLIASDINKQQQSLKTSPSRIDSNTKGREVSRGQFKQKNLEQQIQQTDAAIEMLKQAQIQWGQAKGIYDKDGNNLVADQPLNQQEKVQPNQQEEPIARAGGNFKPKFELAGGTDNYILPEVTVKGKKKFDPFSENNISTGLDIASTLVNFASNQQTASNMANLKTPSYIPLQSIKTSRVNMGADKNAIVQQSKGYEDWVKNNMANPQQAAIIRQSQQNQNQQQFDKINQYEYNANTQIEEQNANRNLQLQQINQQGLQGYNQQVMGKAMSDIQNQSNVTGALLKDVREGLSNRERRTQEDKMYELYKQKYTPGVLRDVTNAMSGNSYTKQQIEAMQKAGIPFRKGGRMKPKFITNK